MQYRLQHKTTYKYNHPVDLGPHIVRLRPTVHSQAKLLSYSLIIEPAGQIRWQFDPWNNRIARVAFPAGLKTDQLSVLVDATVDLTPVNPFDFYVEDWCEQLPFEYPGFVKDELSPFLSRTPDGEGNEISPRLAQFISSCPAEGPVVDYLVKLNRAVADEVEYLVREESGIQNSEETLEKGSGSCRDSALLLCDILRASGLAARFVSGYLVQSGASPESNEGNSDGVSGIETDTSAPAARERRPTAETQAECEFRSGLETRSNVYLPDASGATLDLHAWAEVYIPGAGWIGLDGTSGLLCGEGHIPLACTVAPDQAAPVVGTASSAANRFEVHATAAPIGNEPEPERPYTDEEWIEILEIGEIIDCKLQEQGIELTSGGEPTWTAREEPTSKEWFTEALGESKWLRATRLFAALSGRFGEGVVPIVGTGKIYPGESQPRWALTLLWRPDNEPIWLNADFLDWDLEQGAGGDIRVCREFGKLLCEKLAITPNLIEGVEDPLHFVMAEQNLPIGAEVVDQALASDQVLVSEERKRLARVLDRGLGESVGLAIPLRKEEDGWHSEPWSFRRERMCLIPGDSPMGLRLPLDRIESEVEDDFPADPSLVNGPLQADRGRSRQGASDNRDRESSSDQRAPDGKKDTGSDGGEVKQTVDEGERERKRAPLTALCLEPRGKAVGVFIPPVVCVSDYLDLLEAIEETAVESDVKVRIEGYPPPPDPRMKTLTITPDPGVIEVNMPVCESLRTYARMLDMVAESAEECLLGTEKYQLDGRVVGTGGGHHITLGGPAPLESPFIKHPHLLASLVGYFQRHPCMSYFFTGLFVGPSSQAPRIDEARMDSLYELELALSQVPAPSAVAPPWTSDRLLRHLLVDISGNTHRAEICIDKLYNPDLATGRQGLVELRAFEMPFNTKMAVVEMMLVRALVYLFSMRPVTAKPVRWDTELHDRFMLPHFLWADLCDVLSELQGHGIKLAQKWFVPFLDFRFPVVGTLDAGELELELRVAHEPWHVLGEPIGAASLSRPVDSSLERLQVKVSNFVPERYIVIVNGIELPMTKTATRGQYLAGVRFRAWKPPDSLQPNINVHHPLKFEIVDTWSKSSVAACNYHVVHPEGRLYEEVPLTRSEARARIASRFVEGEHSPWPIKYQSAEPHRDQPITLDLRRYIK